MLLHVLNGTIEFTEKITKETHKRFKKIDFYFKKITIQKLLLTNKKYRNYFNVFFSLGKNVQLYNTTAENFI